MNPVWNLLKPFLPYVLVGGAFIALLYLYAEFRVSKNNADWEFRLATTRPFRSDTTDTSIRIPQRVVEGLQNVVQDLRSKLEVLRKREKKTTDTVSDTALTYEEQIAVLRDEIAILSDTVRMIPVKDSNGFELSILYWPPTAVKDALFDYKYKLPDTKIVTRTIVQDSYITIEKKFWIGMIGMFQPKNQIGAQIGYKFIGLQILREQGDVYNFGVVVQLQF